MPRTMRASLLLLGVLLIVGGCLANVADVPQEPMECGTVALDPEGIRILNVTEDPIEEDASLAWDHESYNVRTCGLAAIGRVVLGEAGVPHKYLGEIDMRGDLNLGAVAVLGNQENPLVYLLDIENRSDPKVVARIPQSGTYITDVKFSPDGEALYTASQSLPGEGILDEPMGTTAPTGFSAYGVKDPSAPTYLGTVVDPSVGCHMLSIVEVSASEEAVFCVSQHLRSYLVRRDADRITNLGFVDYLPEEEGIPKPASPPVAAFPGFASGPHDMTPYHEGGAYGAGKSYMVVSHWDAGLRVVDISQLPVMTEVAAWNGEGAQHYHGNVHTAMMFDVGERRFIIASPEYTDRGAEQIPGLWVLDATDLSDIKLVGEWYHPGNHPAQGLYLTTHQWQVAPTGRNVTLDEVRVYLTYNHAGVWVLDLSKMLEQDHAGAILGFNLARAPLPEKESVRNAVLSTWDVNVVDGFIYGSDRATGLWVFHYEPDILGDVRVRGFA